MKTQQQDERRRHAAAHPSRPRLHLHPSPPSKFTYFLRQHTFVGEHPDAAVVGLDGGWVVGSLLHTYPHSFVPLKSSWVSLVGRQGEGAAAGDRRPLTDSDNWQLALLPRGYPFGSRNGVKVNVGCSSREYCSFICFSRNISSPSPRVDPK